MKYKHNQIIYEVGDWVVIENNGHGGHLSIGATGKIVSEGHAPNFRVELGNKCWYYAGDGDLRLATQEEIDSAKDNIMVGEYGVKFDHFHKEYANSIKVGCVEIPKETFLKIGKKAGWL